MKAIRGGSPHFVGLPCLRINPPGLLALKGVVFFALLLSLDVRHYTLSFNMRIEDGLRFWVILMQFKRMGDNDFLSILTF